MAIIEGGNNLETLTQTQRRLLRVQNHPLFKKTELYETIKEKEEQEEKEREHLELLAEKANPYFMSRREQELFQKEIEEIDPSRCEIVAIEEVKKPEPLIPQSNISETTLEDKTQAIYEPEPTAEEINTCLGRDFSTIPKAEGKFRLYILGDRIYNLVVRAQVATNNEQFGLLPEQQEVFDKKILMVEKIDELNATAEAYMGMIHWLQKIIVNEYRAEKATHQTNIKEAANATQELNKYQQPTRQTQHQSLDVDEVYIELLSQDYEREKASLQKAVKSTRKRSSGTFTEYI